MIDIKQHSLYKPMEVDSVLSNIFNIYFKKFGVLFIYSFVAAFIIQMTFYKIGFLELTRLTDPEDLIKMIFEMRKEILIGSIIYFMIYGSLISFLVNYLIKSDIDPKIHIGDILGESVRKYSIHMIFFLILSVLILVVGIFIGVIALIIGSFLAMIYLGTVLTTGGTIIVVEEKNAIDVIGRTFILAHKDFWSALGSVVLFVLMMLLISIVISAIIAIPFAIMFFDNWHETGSIRDLFDTQIYDIGIWSVVLNSLVSAVTYPLYAILSVVLYFKLKYTEDQKTFSVQ
ncbi:MAG: hypothetical protein K8R31_02945 [Bacteroidales bacterium]|nr:hypothetical protein [Bacteroidales bacterium]